MAFSGRPSQWKVKKKIEAANLWKMIGDEILFYMPIMSKREIYGIPNLVYTIMCELIDNLHEKNPTTRGILSVKSTLWGAFVRDVEVTATDSEPGNVIIKSRNVGKLELDFLGPDIDIGFRISKYALQSKLVIDAKLSCFLSKLEMDLKEKNISEKMRIVSYEKLKGVWEHRHYPIIWYQEGWDSLNDMFLYDEKFSSDIVKRIVDSSGSSLLSISILTKIFSDLNKFIEIQELFDGIDRYKENHPKGISEKIVPEGRMGELHLVAVCFNEKDQVLIAKRTEEKDDFSGIWEFGCAQLHLDQSFSDAMIEGYQENFGIHIEFF